MYVLILLQLYGCGLKFILYNFPLYVYLRKLSLLHIFVINHSFKLELLSVSDFFYSGLHDVL